MSDDKKPLKLGSERPWGETVCGFGLERNECAQPATVHVCWLESMHTSTTCDEHMDYIRETATIPYETHTFAGDCGMPGTLWHHPYEDEDEGYCLFPAVDDAALLVEEVEPAHADH